MRGKFSRGSSARLSDGRLCGTFQSFAARRTNDLLARKRMSEWQNQVIAW